MLLYTDPGSGMLLWQLLVAIFFGAMFYFSRLREWVVAKLRPAHPAENQEAASSAPQVQRERY